MTYCKNYCEETGISTSQLINEAQRTLYYIAENMKMDKSISEEGYRHFQMAIAVLEQEPILDKIRADVERLQKMCDKDDLKLLAQYSAFGMVLEIIDKYKTESEE